MIDFHFGIPFGAGTTARSKMINGRNKNAPMPKSTGKAMIPSAMVTNNIANIFGLNILKRLKK
jgi:hypothetical protein